MKTIIKKSVGGFCIGVTLGVIISLVFAKLWANGGYVPSTPTFMAQYATEWSAMLVSVILWGGMGIVFTLTSMVFERETWSLLKMTATHYLVTLVLFFPLAYLAGWFPHTSAASFGFFLIYTLTYVVIYLLNYLVIWLDVRKINKKIK